jgi:hypothetical protein
MGCKRVFFLVVVALLFGCVSERLAGTEVGNPELTISARFGVIGNSDTVAVTELTLKCMGVAYHGPTDSTGMLWGTPAGYMVKMTDSLDSMGMKVIKAKTGAWSKAEVMLVAPVGSAILPDSIAFAAYSNPRYAKLMRKVGGETLNYLFEIPRALGLKLIFDKSTINTWIHKDSVDIEVLFDGPQWVAGISEEPPTQSRIDGVGGKYLLLGPTENEKTYNRLKSMLPKCFQADSTQML